MSIVAELLSEIDAFTSAAQIAPATFGTRAVNDGKFVDRIRAGGNLTVATIDRVRSYMAAERKKHPELAVGGKVPKRAAPKAA